MENKDINIGDLIGLRNNPNYRISQPFIRIEQLGMGVVIEKLTELLLPVYSESTEQCYNNIAIKINICKVYWFNTTKNTWEYENDLQTI